MDRGSVFVTGVVGVLALVTVAAGPLVSAPISAAWAPWWPVWSGFALIGVVAIHVARQRPAIARVTALRTVLAWLAWATPAWVYALVGGRYGLPELSRGDPLSAAELSHWLDRLTAFSVLGSPPVPDPFGQIGPTLALVAIYAAPVITAFTLWGMWRSGRRGGGA